MKLGTLLKLFNTSDSNNEGTITLEQMDQMIETLYERKVEYQIYFDNLLLKGCKQFGIEDLIMILTETEYYEELRQTVLKKQQENNLSPIQAEMLIAELELSQRNQRRIDYLLNPLINDLLTMLKEYYKQQCKQGNIQEMNRIENRIKEIKQKQQKRWKNYIQCLEKYQQKLVQKNAFQQQYEQQKKWNEFVVDFQNSRFYQFNQLLEKQRKSISEYSKNISEELQPKIFKISKKLIDLRAKQTWLLKFKEFDKAEKIKEEADLLEYLEKKKQETQLKSQVKARIRILKKRQSCQIQAFMQKVASEQASHMIQKQANENRWVNVNKTCLQEIQEKYNKEKIITLASRRSYEQPRTRSAIPQARINRSNYFTQGNEFSINQ